MCTDPGASGSSTSFVYIYLETAVLIVNPNHLHL